MKVTALFQGILSDWIGVPRAEIELPAGGTLADLLSGIERMYGAHMPEQLWDKERKTFHKSVWAMMAEKKLADPAVQLHDGCEVKFLLSLAGG